MRLANIDSSNAALDAQLAYDGDEIVLEGLSGNRTRRYVFGPGVDEPLVAYLVTSTGTTRSWYQADERGSIIRLSADNGVPNSAVGRFDEYGVGAGVSRFHYTGQYWLGDSNLHYYRARIYDPRLGRFLQPDPIGYGAGMNLYAYVGGDPVNAADPNGLTPQAVICTGTRLGCPVHHDSGGSGLNPASSGTSEHVGQPNWAAIKRDPNPVPWSFTGRITNDGVEGTVTLGGRFRGLTAHIGSADLGALLLASAPFDGRIRHEPVEGVFGASPAWWARLDAAGAGRFSRYLGQYLEAILTGAITATRATLDARIVGLPGGKGVFYQRYDVPGSQAFPELFSGARVAWQSGSNVIYLGPYHGEPHPLVPQGWIRLRYAPTGR